MSEKITFKELVELIARQSRQSESSANSFIHELVQIIESGLKRSGSVSISGFGKFELRWMKERPGVNPQTGDEITIPGQNKVVFKPYKALRETVNKPFANLKPEVLSESPESKESEETEDSGDTTNADDPFGLEGVFGSEDPFEADDPFEDDDSFDSDDPLFEEDDPFDEEDELIEEDDPFEEEDELFEEDDELFASEESDEPFSFGNEYESIDDLIFERENPHFGRKETAAVETAEETAVLEIEKEEKRPASQPQKEQPKVVPLLKDESKMAEEVQKSGGFKWSYAAAVIIVVIALIILFLMMQRSGETLEETASTGNQTEQVIEPSTSGEDASDEPAAEEPQPAVDEESPPSTSGPPPNELETETYTVESGQSLWDIAETELGNPYLWPVIYHLNENVLDNPNQLASNANIEIPSFSDPDNLSEFEREQVALGYFSLYQWNRVNNPDEARYFLWAVGVFSQDLLDQPPSEVDSEDLAFARNR